MILVHEAQGFDEFWSFGSTETVVIDYRRLHISVLLPMTYHKDNRRLDTTRFKPAGPKLLNLLIKLRKDTLKKNGNVKRQRVFQLTIT